ncbi:MAG: UbiD family decarboxylase, partial [Deltaproteobacteria bacterium]|nr:UbiD family decarboxylase [Deltaproteobacteria bacterium]
MSLEGYRSLQPCLDDLEAKGDLFRIEAEVDPILEMGCIQRRVYAARGPALLFTRVKGTPFPMVGNLFGTRERIRFIFRHTMPLLERVMNAAADPGQALRRPGAWIDAARAAWKARPRFVASGPILRGLTRVRALPNLVSWPRDGGGYVTLPQVYTEDPDRPGWRHSNLGMYRVQLTGGGYAPDREVGLHYQIHRGIGPHHARALELGRELPVNVFVGGPPAMTLAAIMPLPEGMPEIALAGVLSGSRIPMVRGPNGLPMSAEADFCLCGHIVSGKELPEGPFGDHLGYYSLAHDFPVMRVQTVYHRPGAVWPFTTVGRPPQEDTEFGSLIHELTGPVIPKEFPGVREVHAVDEAGVHPLLLAVASERYVPFV